ncbi:MAG: OFA family MFS transporter [Oscillospiraceae bacterium]|nr:OFA family MFS transporter [Oscillospiraceae bacterium]
MKQQGIKREAVTVLVSGILFNLSIQVLYVWSLLKAALMKPEPGGGWGWTSGQAGLPYTLAIIFFAVGVLIGGRVQDKTGPRIVATAGGIMVGLGLVISGLAGDSPLGAAVGYGVITGLGIGFGYGSVLPACLKWFHPSKKGLIGGLVLGGFGLASVHYAFITTFLRSNYGIQETFIILGIAVTVISVLAAQFIKNPKPEYIPASPGKGEDKQALSPSLASVDFGWREMLKTKRFYLIFILFLFSASMGLMIIGNLARISSLQAGVSNAAFLISLVAVVNALGRIIGGFLSDKIGRVNTLFIAIILQMLNMAGFIFYQCVTEVTMGFIIAGLCFGAFLAVFPALTADQYGLKNYGVNYGIVYLAYGLAGTVAPVIADYFYMQNGNFTTAYIICAVLMGCMLAVNLILKKEINAQLYTQEPEA